MKLPDMVGDKKEKIIPLTIMIVMVLLAALPACKAKEAELSHLKVVAIPYLSFVTCFIQDNLSRINPQLFISELIFCIHSDSPKDYLCKKQDFVIFII